MTGGEKPSIPCDQKQKPRNKHDQNGFPHCSGDVQSGSLPGTVRRPEGNSRNAQIVLTQMEKRSDTDKEEKVEPDVRGIPACAIGENGKNDPRRWPVRSGPMPEDPHFQQIRDDRADHRHASWEVPASHRIDDSARCQFMEMPPHIAPSAATRSY